jgi:hypothetical protein
MFYHMQGREGILSDCFAFIGGKGGVCALVYKNEKFVGERRARFKYEVCSSRSSDNKQFLVIM